LKKFAITIFIALLIASAGAQQSIQTPEQFFGFRMGTDNKLARWDKIVEYFKQVSGASDRIRFRELGKSTNGNPFIALEIASADTLKNLDRYKKLEQKLYFQGGAPTEAERDEIFRQGKAVVLITTTIHATEIGASQMVVELVHRLATDNSPQVKKILDNVIFVLVPSLNPDGQIMVTDWFNKNLGTPFETSGIPYLYHPYVGHDNNRDMYMFTQKESQLTARLLWHDWYPSVWLDEHQQGGNNARIFVMPATDPINPNVHPVIYRWNGILGQSQAAALETAGKEGIIYNSTYTNFWQGAMAWSGWWHNQIGLLTEVASVRVAAPTEQQRAVAGQAPAAGGGRGGRGGDGGGTLPPPTDTTPRTEYPRPWLGGRWTLRDIVDYELIATMALLDTVADRRETLLQQIYEVNRVTVENGRRAIRPPSSSPSRRSTIRTRRCIWSRSCRWRRRRLSRRSAVRGRRPEVRGGHLRDSDVAGLRPVREGHPGKADLPGGPAQPDVAAGAAVRRERLVAGDAARRRPRHGAQAPAGCGELTKLDAAPTLEGKVTAGLDGLGAGASTRPGPATPSNYRGPDAAKALNRLLKDGARVSLKGDRVWVANAPRKSLDAVASELGLQISTADGPAPAGALAVKAPRIGMYSPWTGGNMDEGWTRWVLEQYEFNLTTLHNADVIAGRLRDKYDVIIFPDQSPARDYRGEQRPERPARVPRRHRRRRDRRPPRFPRPGRHAGDARSGLGPRDRALRRAAQEPQIGPHARSALRARHHPQRRSGHRPPARLRHGGQDVRVLQQQPVLQPDRGLLDAEAVGRGPLSKQQGRRVRLAEGRGHDDGTRGGGLDGHQPRAHRPVRPAPAAPAPDPRDLSTLFNALYLSTVTRRKPVRREP
jgi:hypothetical protein